MMHQTCLVCELSQVSINATVQGPTHFSIKGQRVFSTLWSILSLALELQYESSHRRKQIGVAVFQYNFIYKK